MGAILVTGAQGFVGRAVCSHLRETRMEVRAAARNVVPDLQSVFVGDIGPDTDWTGALKGAESVIHCAARVHVMADRADDPLDAYRRVNTAGTANLARQAANAGVRRLVFLSTIKVNGESTKPGRPFHAVDVPCPTDPYSISKYEAELALREVSAQTGLEVVIIRPPLVYGPGAKANFAALQRWLSKGVPLPFGGITGNRRSLVSLGNLVSLIGVCIEHPAAANEIFLVSDGEDLSTTDLLRRMAMAMERKARLISVPPEILESTLGFAGRRSAADRLLGNLQVDIGKTSRLLNWRPPLSVDEGLRRAVGGVL